MYDQGVIKTKKEYDEAMSESAKMTFVGFKSASEDEDDEDNGTTTSAPTRRVRKSTPRV